MDQRHLTFVVPQEDAIDGDPIKVGLEAVNQRLCRPTFLRSLTVSRLPSQAASDASISPGADRTSFASDIHTDLGELRLTGAGSLITEPLDKHDAAVVLTLEWTVDGAIPQLNQQVCSQLEASFIHARIIFSKMQAADRNFQTFSHGHQDLVLAVDFNYYGTRMVTASSDHRLKVWDRKDDNWVLVDNWRAHDAEIVDVKWNGPFTGEYLGSIGEDGRFKLWQEDVTQMPQSGRRFQLIYTLSSQTKVPFMSLDFKNIFQDSYMALITRDGRLSVYEIDFTNIGDWQVLYDNYVCPTPPRQEETGFKVCFHHEKLPCWTAVMAGLDRKSIGLAVAAMDVVKVFRTDKNRKFYLAAELTGARNIIRDVSWANGAMRGHDIIATASKDGVIRVYELSTAKAITSPVPNTASSASSSHNEATTSPKAARKAPSGIGAGLAGASKTNDHVEDNEQNPGQVKHIVKKVDELTQHHGAVWRVSFSQMGDILVSTGDDGTIRTWKKGGSGDRWLEFAEIEAAKDS